MWFVTFEQEGKSITLGFDSIRMDSYRDGSVYGYKNILVFGGVSENYISELIDFIFNPVKIIMKIKDKTITQEIRIIDISYDNDSRYLSIGMDDPVSNMLKFDSLENKDVTQKEDKYYKDDGEPIKCTKCESKELSMKILDYIANVPCEQECRCPECGEIVGYWAYGSWDPVYWKNKKQDFEDYCPECGNYF